VKILSAKQTKALDNYTIEQLPISSIDLMEKASLVFTQWFIQNFDYRNHSVSIFCGPGNNGGDGLAIARLLHHSFYNVQIYLCKIGNQTSEDFDINLKRLPKHDAITITKIEEGTPFPDLPENTIIIDGIFGSGLNRAIEGYWAQLIKYLNEQPIIRVAIDIPSGLFADQHSSGIAIQAHKTFSFELPKFAFFFQENHAFVGQWNFGSIGLLQSYIDQLETSNYYINLDFVKGIFKKRNKYDHKGSFGHAILIAGSYGMIGAALLSTKAALRSGTGLVTLHTPKIAYSIAQGSIPEAMISIDSNEHYISSVPNLDKYSAIGIGPGIGNNKLTINFLDSFLKNYTSPIILDADALNIISRSRDLLNQIPKNSILTPHPKEFERLFGKTENNFERNKLHRNKAKELHVYIVLKGAHTCIACPDGTCYFNATGNPGMATAGSGDVLTGMITSLLAQKYNSKEAAILGVYLHGLAGDLAVEKLGSEEAIIARDIIESIGFAYRKINLKIK
jgi:ADP-dependent NAD(P)H-hydrate dehydratase / NAD(P)H-hydrate epimerase